MHNKIKKLIFMIRRNPIISRIFTTQSHVNFFQMLNEQCDLCAQTMDMLVEYMEAKEPEQALLVRHIDKKGDEIKERNMRILKQSFATPMDREDIYRAITAIDQIMSDAKTTIREMEVLSLPPDPYTMEMARLLQEGVDALRRGFFKLELTPASVDNDAHHVHKMERSTEKVYRQALATLFQADEQIRSLDQQEPGAEAKAMLKVVEMFKRRELYRHLSNTAGQLGKAGDILLDIVMPIA